MCWPAQEEAQEPVDPLVVEGEQEGLGRTWLGAAVEAEDLAIRTPLLPAALVAARLLVRSKHRALDSAGPEQAPQRHPFRAHLEVRDTS